MVSARCLASVVLTLIADEDQPFDSLLPCGVKNLIDRSRCQQTRIVDDPKLKVGRGDWPTDWTNCMPERSAGYIVCGAPTCPI
jgi:hypothetical protein